MRVNNNKNNTGFHLVHYRSAAVDCRFKIAIPMFNDLLRNSARRVPLYVDDQAGYPNGKCTTKRKASNGERISSSCYSRTQKRAGQSARKPGLHLRQVPPMVAGISTPLSCPRVTHIPRQHPWGVDCSLLVLGQPTKFSSLAF